MEVTYDAEWKNLGWTEISFMLGSFYYCSTHSPILHPDLFTIFTDDIIVRPTHKPSSHERTTTRSIIQNKETKPLDVAVVEERGEKPVSFIHFLPTKFTSEVTWAKGKLWHLSTHYESQLGQLIHYQNSTFKYLPFVMMTKLVIVKWKKQIKDF